jgi:glycosyltransferase AglD
MISVVMPAHNEERHLAPAVKTVVSGLRESHPDFELIVVENGSVDSTLVEARRLESTFSEVTVITTPDADYGAALKRGFLASRGEIVANFDVDLVDLGFLDKALTTLEETGASMVVGSKRSPGSHDRRSFARRTVTATFGVSLRYGFGLRTSDTHGLKAMRRAPLQAVVESCVFGADIYDTELVIRAERLGLGVEEIPVTVEELRPPRTPISRRIPRTLVGLARLRRVLGRPSSHTA